jgi:lipopolysaccharide transport system ATP-binding protein
MPAVISVERLSKAYRLGQIGTGTLTYDMQVWWAKVRGKPNPLLKIGEQDHRSRDGETIWALRDISFEVRQGEVLGIIGRNGAGKSTLLKILSRVTAPTSGRITGNGRVASLLEVGTGFHPELTGRENIYLNGAILGMSRREIDGRFDEIVDFAEVEQFINTPVKRYSSGMYVRLAFAVAAHLEPEILVVDEVLAVGDAEFQKKCLGKMGDVAKEGRTVLFVSHNMAALNAICKRVILFDKGSILIDGETARTISHYLSSENRGVSEKVWHNIRLAPGNQNVRLRSVRLSSHGKSIDQLESNHPVDIEIEFWNLRPRTRHVVQFKLVDSSGIIVLESFNTPEASNGTDPLALESLEIGLYRSICRIPSNFLNDQQYFVTVIIASLNPAIKEAEVREVVSFTVFDSGSMRTPGLNGKWFGVIRTPLVWNTTFLVSGAPVEIGE